MRHRNTKSSGAGFAAADVRVFEAELEQVVTEAEEDEFEEVGGGKDVRLGDTDRATS